MASSSFFSSTSPFGFHVSEKVTKGNFILWQAQVLPAIRGTRLTSYLDGSIEAPKEHVSVKQGDKDVIEPGPNPKYEDWVAQDQKVLSLLISSLSREVQPHAMAAKMVAKLWEILQEMYAS
jgi:hypothetical protein